MLWIFNELQGEIITNRGVISFATKDLHIKANEMYNVAMDAFGMCTYCNETHDFILLANFSHFMWKVRLLESFCRVNMHVRHKRLSNPQTFMGVKPHIALSTTNRTFHLPSEI
jgi:hypothetical protein